MKPYLDLLSHVMVHGERHVNRTGVDTLSVFGAQTRHDLTSLQIPLVTTKKVHWKSVVAELLWFISGSTNIKDLDASIWDEWADENGELGPVYGYQWRKWSAPFAIGASYAIGHMDQLGHVIQQLKDDPFSRRHIVTAWNPAEIGAMKLPPCHLMYQFKVKKVERGHRLLSCMMTIRSCDLFLGAPFNIASYALLTHLIAQVAGMEALELVVSYGDAHIYTNHLDQVRTQLQREPEAPPWVVLDTSITDIDEFGPEHIMLMNYTHHPAIKGKVAV